MTANVNGEFNCTGYKGSPDVTHVVSEKPDLFSSLHNSGHDDLPKPKLFSL